MTLSISSVSLEYVKVPVRFKRNGIFIDPTGYVVALAYTAVGSKPTVWTTGSWETAGSLYLARVLTGPAGDVTPAVGTWMLWVKVTASPEAPAMAAGQVVIT